MGFWDASISSSDHTHRHIQFKYLAIHKISFRKETSRFEVFMEHFPRSVGKPARRLNRPLKLFQNNVTSRALASLELFASFACGHEKVTDINGHRSDFFEKWPASSRSYHPVVQYRRC